LDGILFVSEPERNNRAILLFHGMTGTPTELVYLARILYKEGFDVYCPPLPGHLKGREDVMRPSWKDWMQFARDEYERIAPRYASLSVGGVCVGAVIASALSTERKCSAVVCMAPILRHDGWSIPWYHIFSWFPLLTPLKFFFVFPEGDTLGIRDEEVRAKIGESMGKEGDALDCFPLICVRQMLDLGHYLKTRLAKVTAPILVIHSERDDVADISNAKEIYHGVSSAKKEFMAVRNSYHLVTLDRDKDAVNAKVVQFLVQEAGPQ
jgi:carboxylesterase